jgi:hypothetical protein
MIEDVSEIGLRVEAVPLGLADDRHGAGEDLGAGVGAREDPVFFRPMPIGRRARSAGLLSMPMRTS